MAQPFKGDRVVTVTRLARPVWADVQQAATERGMSISQYIADVLAAHVGRADLVRDLGDREVLPLAM
jgi:predicted DNA-binding ribbon-helix-helix protein